MLLLVVTIKVFAASSRQKFSFQSSKISRRKASKLLQNSRAFNGRNEVAAGRIWSNQVRDFLLVIRYKILVGIVITYMHVGLDLRLLDYR